MCHHVLTKPCQKQANAEKRQVMKMVPRRPNLAVSAKFELVEFLHLPVIVRDRQPAADERTADIGCAVHQASQPSRAFIVIVDAELRGVEKLSAVDDSLVCIESASCHRFE